MVHLAYLTSLTVNLLSGSPFTSHLVAVRREPAIVHIGKIQAGTAALNDTYRVAGVVTGVCADARRGGFYIQEMAVDSDGDPTTSDAIFVSQKDPVVRVGDQVVVEGGVERVALGADHTQAQLTRASVTVRASSHALPAFVVLSQPTFTAATLQAFAGMRVELGLSLTVSEVYDLEKKGEVLLSAGGLLFQPTQFLDPNDEPATGVSSTGSSNVAAIRTLEQANRNRSLLLDNALAAVRGPVPFLDPATRTLRVGSNTQRLRGVLGYGEAGWRLHALPDLADAPAFVVRRPALPAFGRVDVRLASFNVLNYFNGDGQKAGFPTPRGARTAEDFARQRAKIVAALAAINADIVGLTEVENDGTGPTSAAQDLLRGLNERVGAGTYALVDDGGVSQQPNNTDLIHCVMLYKPAAVRLLGPARLDLTPGVYERPPLAQRFAVTGADKRAEKLTVIINHLKARGGNAPGEEADQNDGQGAFNHRRREQAHALSRFVQQLTRADATERVVSIGDYNANYEEDPIDVLRAAGLVVVTPPTSASYVYRGLTGSLDHCLVTPNLVGFIDVQKWNINSAEPAYRQYDHAGAEAEAGTPCRSSDHDPVLIGIRFMGIANASISNSASRLLKYPNLTQSPGVFQLSDVVPAAVQQLTLGFYLPQGIPLVQLQGAPAVLQAELGRYTAHLAPGIYQVRLRAPGGFRLTQQLMKE